MACTSSTSCQSCQPGYSLIGSTCNSLTQPEITQTKAIAAVQQAFGTAADSCAKAISAIKYANPVSLCLAVLIDMVVFLRYVNISYPPKLQLMFDSADDLSISFIPNIPNQLANAFPSLTLPDNFQKYSFPSAFFVNFWQPEIALLVLTLVLLVVCVLEKCTKKCAKTMHKICVKLKGVLKWNYAITLLLGYSGQILFFASFDFATNELSKLTSIFSFLLCCVLHLALVYIFFKMLHVIVAIRRTRPEDINTTPSTDNPSHHEPSWQEYEIVFAEFKNTSFLHQAYLPIYTLRVYVFYLVIAYMYRYPLGQMIVLTLLNICMILYLGIIQPPKSRVQLIENLVVETVLLLVDAPVLLLAILDNLKSEAFSTRKAVGEMVTWLNTGLCIVGGTYLLLKLIISVFLTLRNAIRRCRNRQRMPPLRVNTRGGVATSVLNQDIARTSSNIENGLRESDAKQVNKPHPTSLDWTGPISIETNSKKGSTRGNGQKSSKAKVEGLEAERHGESSTHNKRRNNIQSKEAEISYSSRKAQQNPEDHFDQSLSLYHYDQNFIGQNSGNTNNQAIRLKSKHKNPHRQKESRTMAMDQMRIDNSYITNRNNQVLDQRRLANESALSLGILNQNESFNSSIVHE